MGDTAGRSGHPLGNLTTAQTVPGLYFICTDSRTAAAGEMHRMKELVAEVVAAFVKRNAVSTDQLPTLIASTAAAFSALGQSEPASAPTAEALVPAISVRRSIRPDTITCLECGKSSQMLKRHLASAHGMTPAQYRERWKLAGDYPMVAPNYANRRSELAKSIGLGRRGKRRAKG
jgi:predicted transcriptional regulator